jgi:hypothetical protein
MFILLISGLGLPVIFASTSTLVGDDLFATGTYQVSTGRYDTQQSPPQQRLLYHSSGRIIVVRLSAVATTHLYVMVYSDSGELLGSTDLYNEYGGYGALVGGFSVAEVSDTEIVVIAGNSNCIIYFIRVNIITYSHTHTSVTFTASGACGIERIGMPIEYNGALYTFIYDYGYSSGTGFGMCKYVMSTSTLTKAEEVTFSHNNYVMPPYGYLDEANGKIYYLVTQYGTNTLLIYEYNIGTHTFTLICTSPASGGFPSSNCFRYGYGNFITFYGGGIENYGTYYYLYFAWSYSDRTGAVYPSGSGVRFVSTYFWYMKFNNSISAGTLLSQARLTDYELDSSSSTSASCGLGYGYLYHSNTTSTFDLYTYYQDISAGKHLSRVTYHILDIEADPTEFDTEYILQGVDNLDFKLIDTDCQMYYDMAYGIAYHQKSDAYTYLVTGEEIPTQAYTEEFVYSPADDPLVTSKYYTFLWTIYKDGILATETETYRIYVDGMLQKTGTLVNGNGVAGVMINMAGVHTFQLQLFDYTTDVKLYTGTTHEFIVSSSSPPAQEPPSTPTLIGYYSDIFMLWLPMGIIVFMPLVSVTMVGAKYAGGSGAIVGMIFGGTVGIIGGTVVGIIPPYALYLLVILIATAIVLLLVRGSSGGGSQV